jgi:hypothetical protein
MSEEDARSERLDDATVRTPDERAYAGPRAWPRGEVGP